MNNNHNMSDYYETVIRRSRRMTRRLCIAAGACIVVLGVYGLLSSVHPAFVFTGVLALPLAALFIGLSAGSYIATERFLDVPHLARSLEDRLEENTCSKTMVG